MSIKQALQGPRPNEAKQAILSEIQNMIDYSVGHSIHYEHIPESKRANILRLFMFIKKKYKPNKTHDKTKARIVGDDSHQGSNTYDIISSTTVNICSVFKLLSIRVEPVPESIKLQYIHYFRVTYKCAYKT